MFIKIGQVIINSDSIETVKKDMMNLGTPCKSGEFIIRGYLKGAKMWEATGFEIFKTEEERDVRFMEIANILCNNKVEV